MELNATEIAVVRDLLEAYLVDGTHEVDEQAAWALHMRLNPATPTDPEPTPDLPVYTLRVYTTYDVEVAAPDVEAATDGLNAPNPAFGVVEGTAFERNRVVSVDLLSYDVEDVTWTPEES